MGQQSADGGQGKQPGKARAASSWRKKAILLLAGVIGGYIAISAVVAFAQREDSVTDGGLSLHATSTKSNSSFNASSITSSGENVPFRCGRIALINQSGHPLLGRALPQVVEELRKLPFAHQVDYFESGQWPEPAKRLHDFYILVDMPVLKESGMLPTGRKIDATITVSAGSSLWEPNHRVTDHLTPPMVEVDLRGTLEHHSTTTEVGSAGARYRQPAEDVAKQLAGELTKKLSKWAEEHGIGGDVPEALCPPYRPVPDDLPRLQVDGTEQLISGHGLLLHNLTIWRATSENWPDALSDLQQRLREAGWKVSDWGNARAPGSFRAERDGAMIDGFPLSQDRTPGEPDGSQQIIVRYRDRMSSNDINLAIAQIMEQDSALPVLVSLTRNMNPEMRNRLAERIIQQHSPDPAMQLLAARYLHEQKRDDEALERLRLAWTFCRAAGQSQQAEAIKELARKITGDSNWKPAPPTEEMLNRLGVQRLDGNGLEKEVALNEPVLVYIPSGADGESSSPYFGMVKVESATIPEGVYSVLIRTSSLDGLMSQSRQTQHNPSRPFCDLVSTGIDALRLIATVQETEAGRFKLSLKATHVGE